MTNESEGDDDTRAMAAENETRAGDGDSDTPARRSRVWLAIASVVAMLLVLVVAAVATLLWAVQSPSGTAWLVAHVPHVVVRAPRGTLIGDFAADAIEITVPASGVLRLDGVRWQGLAVARGDHGRWLHVRVAALHADRAQWLASTERAPQVTAAEPPTSLRLPIELEIDRASIDALRVGGDDATPIRELGARVHLGADGGARHRIDDLAAERDGARGTGGATIGADPPLAVVAHAALASSDGAALPWRASMDASGALARLDVAVAARVLPGDGKPAQTIDARAVLRPFAAWPLGALEARADALDLSAFASAAPATSLTGRAVATTTARDEPVSVHVDVANARAGRWNEGRLPVVRLQATLRARADAPGTIVVETLQAMLGERDGAVERSGGSIAAHGRWTANAWSLVAQLDALRPAALDARAPDMTTSGTLSLTGSDFAAPAERRAIDIVAQLSGRLLDRRLPRAAPQAVRLHVDGRAMLNAIELRTVDAAMGDASASANARLVRANTRAPWHANGKLRLANFDPLPWWPGAPDAWLARGGHRLNGSADVDLALPASTGASVYDALASTRGHAELRVAASTLAGVPIEGNATFANSDGRARATFEVVAAGNRASGNGRLAAAGSSDDDWQLAVDAPSLDALAAWLPTPAGRADAALAGTLTASAHVAGRWPAIRSEGDVHASALRASTFAVRRIDGRWRAGSAADAPIDATFDVDDALVAGRAIAHADARLAGTARAHRGELRIVSAALPPAWADVLVAAHSTSTAATTTIQRLPTAAAASTSPGATSPAQSAPAATSTSATSLADSNAGASSDRAARSIASLTFEGGLLDVGGEQNAGWSGSVRELVVQSSAAPARTWLAAHDVRGTVTWGGAAPHAMLEAGAAEALGTTVRWSRIAWQSGADGRAGRLDAQATIDPIAVGPLLRALQPDFGWGGDLAVGARVDIRSAPTVSADIVVERARGDLSVTDEVGTTPLGFSDLRLAVTARGGVWNFSAGVAGSTYGVASAAIVARTADATAWPTAATPLDGTVQLDVAKLGAWGRWLPTGWRLDGTLHANARIAGRIGAPSYTGRIDGSDLSAHNFLQGVDVTDGTLAIALRGDNARIERFTAKGGDGTVRLEGNATFGEAPVAELSLVAERFRLLGRVDRRIVASGRGAMRLDAKAIALDGAFKVDEGLIDFTRSDAPTLGDDVVVVRRTHASPAAEQQALNAPARTTTSAAATPAPVARQVALDLRVDMGERLRVRGRGLDAGLRGELHLTSPNGRLAVAGTLRTVDGTYQAYGQKLVIDRGVLAFAGPVENPRLDVEATRPNLDVRVGVLVSGTALAPRVQLFSEPAMSDLDKLSWLIVGRASETVGGADTALLQAAALGLLSGEGPGMTDRLVHAIGLDEIGVRQAQGQGEVKETIVSLGKQLSKRWYVGYEQGLTATTGSWQLIYRIAQRLTVRAQAGGDNAIDLNWTLRWR